VTWPRCRQTPGHKIGLATTRPTGFVNSTPLERDRSSSVPRGIVAASPCGTTSEYSLIQEQQQITRLQRVLRPSASAQSQRKGAVAPCSWTPQESQVERCEHQDDSNIHCQPFPESVSEEHEIYTNYDGCHRHPVKHVSYLSAHLSPWFNRKSNQAQERILGRTPSAPLQASGLRLARLPIAAAARSVRRPCPGDHIQPCIRLARGTPLRRPKPAGLR